MRLRTRPPLLTYLLGSVGFEPRTSSLECTCLYSRVKSNALMRTVIAV